MIISSSSISLSLDSRVQSNQPYPVSYYYLVNHPLSHPASSYSSVQSIDGYHSPCLLLSVRCLPLVTNEKYIRSIVQEDLSIADCLPVSGCPPPKPPWVLKINTCIACNGTGISVRLLGVQTQSHPLGYCEWRWGGGGCR